MKYKVNANQLKDSNTDSTFSNLTKPLIKNFFIQ